MVSPLALCSSMRLKFFERFGVGWLGEGGEAEVAGSVASRAHTDAISRRHTFLPQPGHPPARLHEFVAHNKTLLPAADAGAQLRCARRTRALQLICFGLVPARQSVYLFVNMCQSLRAPLRIPRRHAYVHIASLLVCARAARSGIPPPAARGAAHGG